MGILGGEKQLLLWLLRLPKSVDADALYHFLDEAQQERADGLSGQRRRIFLATRRLLKFVLEQPIFLQLHDWRVEERIDLPPVLIDKSTAKPGERASLSISHSGEYIGIALNVHGYDDDSCIGLDLERLDVPRQFESAAFFCTHDELGELREINDERQQIEAMVKLWVCKEAFFKAHHRSILNTDLKKTAFSCADSTCGGIKTAVMEEPVVVSVYYPKMFNIKTQIVCFDSEGDLVVSGRRNPIWHSLTVIENPGGRVS